MLWKLFSAVTLVNFGGREIDQSALVRYLTEAVYFPTALLPSRTLRWEELDADSARATLVSGQSVHACCGISNFPRSPFHSKC